MATTRLKNDLHKIKIAKDVRQEDNISPNLFTSQNYFQENRLGNDGIKYISRILQLRFSVDITVILGLEKFETEKGLKKNYH